MTTPSNSRSKARRRGSITKTKTGGFLARLRTAPDALTGKRGGHSKTFDIKADAEQWLNDELTRIDRGEVVNTSNNRRTLSAFLQDFYLYNRKTTRGRAVLSERRRRMIWRCSTSTSSVAHLDSPTPRSRSSPFPCCAITSASCPRRGWREQRCRASHDHCARGSLMPSRPVNCAATPWPRH